MDQREWSAIDKAASREGSAIKRAFKRPRIKDGATRTSIQDQSRDYRAVSEEAARKDILARRNVIDGRATCDSSTG